MKKKLVQLYYFTTIYSILATMALLGVIFSLTGLLSRPRTTNICRNGFHILLKLIDLKCHLHNEKNLPPKDNKKPIIFMSNHTSLLDIPIAFKVLPGDIRMVAKKELFKIPVWGKAMRAAEFISIDRQHGKQAKQDLAYAEKKLRSGISVWIAPGGTRSKDEIGHFKNGAFKLAHDAKAIIIPMFISGADKTLPARTWNLSPHQTINVYLGPPIDSQTYTNDKASLLELKAKVSNSVATLYNQAQNTK